MANLDEIREWLELPPDTAPAALADECRKRLAGAEDLLRKNPSKTSTKSLKRKIEEYGQKLALIQRALDSEKAAGLLKDFEAALGEKRKARVANLHDLLGRIPKDAFTEEQRDLLGRLEADACDAGINLESHDFSAEAQEAERARAEQARAEQEAAKKATEEKAAAEQAEAERIAAAKLAAEQRAEAEKIAAEQKAAAEKAEAERKAAAEQAAKKTAVEDDAGIAGRTTIQTDGRLRIPRPFLNNVQPGGRLSLVPADAANAAIHLISRDEFKLGRGDPDVDFVTWFLPRSKENDTKTRHLSKVHVIARIEDGQPCLRDNSGNGAYLDDEPVTQVGWDAIIKRGVLRLGAEYRLDVQPVSPASAKDPDIANIRSWSGPSARKSGPRGCLRFSPINGPARRDALWLFTDAAFGSSPANPIVINNAELAGVQGRFYFFRDCFWVENVAKEGTVALDGTPLKSGEIAPLAGGQTLRLGKACYRVEVVA